MADARLDQLIDEVQRLLDEADRDFDPLAEAVVDLALHLASDDRMSQSQAVRLQAIMPLAYAVVSGLPVTRH